MRERLVSVERLIAIATKAQLGGYGAMTPFDNGGFRRVMHLELGMDCVQPYRFTLFSRWSAEHAKKVKPFTITAASRCRKCEKCAKRRAMFWSGRAITEYGKWPYTAMGTFTLSMDEHYLLDARLQAGEKDASGRWVRHPLNYRGLTDRQIFTARAREFGREVTRYFKRCREALGRPSFSYLLIAEAHDSARTDSELRGRPHYHVLIHEHRVGTVFLGDPRIAREDGADGEWVKKKYRNKRGVWKDGLFLTDEAILRQQWKLGFSKFQLAEDSGTVGYLCKYLTKQMEVRVRASIDYGLDPKDEYQTALSGNEVDSEASIPTE